MEALIKNKEEAAIQSNNLQSGSAGVIIIDSFYAKYGKRILDILVSLAALIITAPINLLIGLITYVDVGRPLFFRQLRVGKDLKQFQIVKFRNMRDLVDDKGALLPPEDRVTAFGKIVRKTSLDELLNFWNVLKGDMSIIGPRPLLVDYLPYYSERQLMRHAVRPGLECPSLIERENPRYWEEQFEDDIWYVEHVSLETDLRMMLALIKLVFNKKEVKRRGMALRGRFDNECIKKKSLERNISEEKAG